MNTVSGETKISEVMTPLPYTALPDETLEAVKKIMYEKDIRHLPVIDSNKVIGVLTDRDMKLAFGVAGGLLNTSEIRVQDACVMEPYAVEPDTPLTEVLEHMLEKHIGSALIVDGGLPAGIFTLHDATRLLWKQIK